MDFDILLLGIKFIELFKDFVMHGNNEFLSYMNDNNSWCFMNDSVLIQGMIGSELEEIEAIFSNCAKMQDLMKNDAIEV